MKITKITAFNILWLAFCELCILISIWGIYYDLWLLCFLSWMSIPLSMLFILFWIDSGDDLTENSFDRFLQKIDVGD